MKPDDKEKHRRELAERAKKKMLDRGLDEHTSKGKYFELAISSLLQTYVEDEKGPPSKYRPLGVKTSRTADILKGTDIIMDDHACTMLKERIARIDTTFGFLKKDCMPLVTPGSGIKLLGEDRRRPFNRGKIALGNPRDDLRFGVRIGSGSHGFDFPVVVLTMQSDDRLDDHRIRDNVLWLHDNIEQMAPEVMKTVIGIKQRVRYMTDPAYKAELDQKYGPARVDRDLPVLVPNWPYLDAEKERLDRQDRLGIPHTCTSGQVTALGQLKRGRDDWPASVTTDVPWMSKTAHDLIAAMPGTPRAISDERMQVIGRLLKEPYRARGNEVPFVVGPDMKPLEGPLQTPAMKALAAALHEKYEETDPDKGPHPWLDRY